MRVERKSHCLSFQANAQCLHVLDPAVLPVTVPGSKYKRMRQSLFGVYKNISICDLLLPGLIYIILPPPGPTFVFTFTAHMLITTLSKKLIRSSKNISEISSRLSALDTAVRTCDAGEPTSLTAMHLSVSLLSLALAALVVAIPITPSAPELQSFAEQMRIEGMSEHDIAEQLYLTANSEVTSVPIFSQLSSQVYSLFDGNRELRKRDITGDIAPGSLEAPQMLPRAAAPPSFADTLRSLLWRGDLERREFGYEGKELEMRRPEGMRHWD
ncbi:hypothetical protein M011DRAFT_473711 [Sporormia fimetaria CBS 119925]|uniref:Uncharacterized protein n=1 Tax=Sporormia fimetaria CBS 119925 TaxID=1340428 RepID=A0A6A6VN90_9PLEO|nr:hypothetical protein M011DRAFT_473711 [Sporormia fimetaria CBS 119925]